MAPLPLCSTSLLTADHAQEVLLEARLPQRTGVHGRLLRSRLHVADEAWRVPTRTEKSAVVVPPRERSSALAHPGGRRCRRRR